MKKRVFVAIFLFFLFISGSSADSSSFVITGPGLQTYNLSVQFFPSFNPETTELSVFINATFLFDSFSSAILSNVYFNFYLVKDQAFMTNASLFQQQIDTSNGSWTGTTTLTIKYLGGMVDLKFNLTFLESIDQGTSFQPAEFRDLSISSFEFSTTPLFSPTTPTTEEVSVQTLTEPNNDFPIGVLIAGTIIFFYLAGITSLSSRRKKFRKKRRITKLRKKNKIAKVVKPINQTYPNACVSCGAPISKGDSFCYSCGVKLEPMSTVEE